MLKKIFNILLKAYGAQGWWPLLSHSGRRGFDDKGYHKADYRILKNTADQFEIAVGAILTQNTAWLNVEKALINLSLENCLSPERILSLPEERLAQLVKPSGYFNQKAKKLKAIADLFTGKGRRQPGREELLAVWGVGPETSDSILLYAYGVPVFVIDAYTRRIFGRIGLLETGVDYVAWQQFFHIKLKPDAVLYNEYHALIVVHGKDVCKVKPLCGKCVLKNLCRYGEQTIP